MKMCVYCEKELTGRKRKYCDEVCRYRYLSIKNATATGSYSKSQCLRMTRAARAQSAGRVGCRYN